MLAAACALATPAPTQDPAVDLLLSLREDPDPTIRGETALLLAHLAPDRAEAPSRAAAGDRSGDARALGMLALGRLAPAGAEVLLGRAFEDDRDPTVRLAAAHALALLPDSQPTPALDRYFTRVDGGNYRRNRDALAAIVAGMVRTPHPSRRASLQRLLDDAANRDGGLRGLVVLALGVAGDQPADDELRARLTGEHVEVRLATLSDLAGDPARAVRSAEQIADLARHDRDARVRSRALDVLIAARRPDALELAAAAMRGPDAAVVSAGVTATTELGGGALRDELVGQIATELDPRRQAAMFGAWRGPVPTALADAAFAFSADRRHTAPDRALATHLLARAADERAIPLLRALVVEGEDGATVAQVVEDLERLGAADDLAERFGGDDVTALRRLAPRLEALFRLDRPEAIVLLRDALADDRLGDSARAELLRAWRRSVVPPPGPDVGAALPRALRALLR